MTFGILYARLIIKKTFPKSLICDVRNTNLVNERFFVKRYWLFKNGFGKHKSNAESEWLLLNASYAIGKSLMKLR